MIVFHKVAPAVRPPPPVAHQGLQQFLGRGGLHGAERHRRRPPLLLLLMGEPLVVLVQVGPERRYVCGPHKNLVYGLATRPKSMVMIMVLNSRFGVFLVGKLTMVYPRVYHTTLKAASILLYFPKIHI